MPGQVTTRDTMATDHVTFVSEADSLTETTYGLFDLMGGAFSSVVENNWTGAQAGIQTPTLNAIPLETPHPISGDTTVSVFIALGPNLTTNNGTVAGAALPLTDANGNITNPENLFTYFIETEFAGLASDEKDTFDHLMEAYRDYVISLVRTDTDTDDGVLIEDFDLYGETISKYLPDDGDPLTPRVLQPTAWSTQVKDAIADIFDKGEADIIDEVKGAFLQAYLSNFGPDGTSNFQDATGISGATIYRKAEEHFLENCFAGGGNITSNGLVDGWLDFIAVTATVTEDDAASAPWSNLVDNFQDAYDSAVGTSSSNFGKLLSYFVREVAFPTDGYFVPGEHFAEWETFLQTPSVQSDPEGFISGILDCPPPPEHRRMDMILVEILDLITVVLKRFEETIVVQSNANLLNQDIQRKYTELISQVQLEDTSTIDTEDTEELEELKSNNEIIQKRLEDLRNARTEVRDKGKELTDALSASSDQVEQQSQLGSSVISQLGELIRAIFK